MGEWIASWVLETPDFPSRTRGRRAWFMACAAIGFGSLAACLGSPRRWVVVLATIVGGVLGVMLSAAIMRAQARRSGVPLVARETGSLSAYNRALPTWQFLLHVVLPLNVAGVILCEQCFESKSLLDFSAHGYCRFADGIFNITLLSLIGRWFMRHTLKGRDDWGLDMTKGRIAPAPRVR